MQHCPPVNIKMSQPVALLVVGMAGSGKSTFVQMLNAHLLEQEESFPYLINLDPAIPSFPDEEVPFNLDIRDTVDYKSVMKEYNLGPNGAILTSLNLFATKFDQVIELVQARDPTHVLVDTPGQIEIFTWSASGNVISTSFSDKWPTVMVYVVDAVRCIDPNTFISNMLYACSIMYKSKLPFVLVFNKIDLQPSEMFIEWMTDFEAFQQALHEGEREASFSTSLVHSMSLVLEEFYAQMQTVSVSATTGQGMDEFMRVVQKAALEWTPPANALSSEGKDKPLEQPTKRSDFVSGRTAVDSSTDDNGTTESNLDSAVGRLQIK